MGTFHTFGDLRQYGEKLLKFKQLATVQAAEEQIINSDHFSVAKEGMCSALSLAWLEQQVYPATAPVFQRGNRHKPKVRGKFHTALERWNLEANKKVVVTAAPRYYAYSLNEKWDAANNTFVRDEEAALKALAKDYHLDLDRFWMVRAEGVKNPLQELLAYCEQHLAKGQALLISYDHGTDKSHTVALARTGEGVFHFFDPNVGEYRINGGQYGNFFTAYLACIQKPPLYISDIGLSFAFRVLPAAKP
jgi:hypothetical protein